MNEETLPNTVGNETADFLQQSKAHALQAAEELRAAASIKAQQLREAASASANRLRESATETSRRLKETAEERALHAREVASQQWDSARNHAREWGGHSEAYIGKTQPKLCLPHWVSGLYSVSYSAAKRANGRDGSN